MEMLSFIVENSIIVIPVLLVIGKILKDMEKISDKYIPVILLPVGIAFTICIGGFTVNAIIQGILVTGTAVYGNQLYKQFKGGEVNANSEEDNYPKL